MKAVIVLEDIGDGAAKVTLSFYPPLESMEDIQEIHMTAIDALEFIKKSHTEPTEH